MDDDSIMKFGKHRGKPLSKVPSDYLLWWWDMAEGFRRTGDPLHAYVKSAMPALLEKCPDFILLHKP